jgi:hypothetical protein
MADDFYGFEEEEQEEKGRDNLFLWTVFILLLIGVAFACWLGSFYVFGHPEKPWCYKTLKKLGKIDPPKRFEVTAGPPGDFLSAPKLFEKYSKFTRLELEEENAQLLRDYIKNYRETKKLVPYITGKFNIINSVELNPAEMFPSGVVAVAQSADFPQVLIEHVYPVAKGNVAAARAMLQTGFGITIERTNDLSAVIHIERIYDGRLQFTLVPLLYDTKALRHGVGMLSLEPPADLSMEAGLPVIKEKELKDALVAYNKYRRTRPLPDETDAATTPANPELVRVDTTEPGSKVPEKGAMPQMPVATPIPIASGATPKPVAPATPPKPIVVATPAATPPPVTVAMVATPPPRVEPAATPARVSPTGVPLQPFLAANPAPGSVPNAPGVTWRTYAPGQAPAARSLTPAEAMALADRGDLGERIYLRGDFRVTASGDTPPRAVMRDKVTGESARIIVEFPAGAVPPAENSVISRDPSRPFQIRDVRRGDDGQVNIYVREITAQ